MKDVCPKRAWTHERAGTVDRHVDVPVGALPGGVPRALHRGRPGADRVYEIVLVNDGSPDDSLRVALDLHARDPRVRIIDLSRNFGHHKALMTGLAHARGELVFLIDCDLEEDPEWLSPLPRRR